MRTFSVENNGAGGEGLAVEFDFFAGVVEEDEVLLFSTSDFPDLGVFGVDGFSVAGEHDGFGGDGDAVGFSAGVKDHAVVVWTFACESVGEAQEEAVGIVVLVHGILHAFRRHSAFLGGFRCELAGGLCGDDVQAAFVTCGGPAGCAGFEGVAGVEIKGGGFCGAGFLKGDAVVDEPEVGFDEEDCSGDNGVFCTLVPSVVRLKVVDMFVCVPDNVLAGPEVDGVVSAFNAFVVQDKHVVGPGGAGEVAFGVVVPEFDSQVQFEGMGLAKGVTGEGEGFAVGVTGNGAVVEDEVAVCGFPAGSHNGPVGVREVF